MDDIFKPVVTMAGAFELSFLSLFWVLSATVVLFTHILITTCDRKLPDMFKAAWLFGKLKSISKIESETPFPVPKRWFTHFYAFGLVVHSIVFTLFYLLMGNPSFMPGAEKRLGIVRYPVATVSETNLLPVVMVFTMEWMQMARRLSECLFTSSFSNGTMSPVHYFYGMFLYSSFGMGLLSSVDVNNLRFSFASGDLLFLVPSALLFIGASYFQHKAFVTFASLRKPEKGKPAKGHFIPKGHLFKWVSCPHYLCEIIIYCSLCLVFHMRSVYLNSLLSFVVVNQISCSILAHDWYRKTFRNYPRGRKAVIPFLL